MTAITIELELCGNTIQHDTIHTDLPLTGDLFEDSDNVTEYLKGLVGDTIWCYNAYDLNGSLVATSEC